MPHERRKPLVPAYKLRRQQRARRCWITIDGSPQENTVRLILQARAGFEAREGRSK